MVKFLHYLITTLISILVGAMSGWVLGLVFSGAFMNTLNAFGADTLNVTMWQLGAAFGFLGCFINYSTGVYKSLGVPKNLSDIFFIIFWRFSVPLFGAVFIIIPSLIAGIFFEDTVFAGLAAFGVDTSELSLWQVSVTLIFIGAHMIATPHPSIFKKKTEGENDNGSDDNSDGEQAD